MRCWLSVLLMWIRVRGFVFPLKNVDFEIISGLTGLPFNKVKKAAKGGKKGFAKRLAKAAGDC